MQRDADEVIHDVGRRVAELRQALGYTQAELAERLEVSDKYIQRIEAGGENLSLRSLAKLAIALKVDVREFFRRPSRCAEPGRQSRRRRE